MPTARIEFDQNELEDVCQRWHIRRLSFFGEREVDLTTPAALSPHVRDKVLEAAQVSCAA